MATKLAMAEYVYEHIQKVRFSHAKYPLVARILHDEMHATGLVLPEWVVRLFQRDLNRI